MKKAAEGRYHILQEGSLENVAHTLDYISYLKDMGYEICVLLRACLKRKAGRPFISSSFSSG